MPDQLHQTKPGYKLSFKTKAHLCNCLGRAKIEIDFTILGNQTSDCSPPVFFQWVNACQYCILDFTSGTTVCLCYICYYFSSSSPIKPCWLDLLAVWTLWVGEVMVTSELLVDVLECTLNSLEVWNGNTWIEETVSSPDTNRNLTSYALVLRKTMTYHP